MLYIGSALGVVFAADFISLYLFWEVMAVTSAVLIFMGPGKQAAKAAYRYLLVHIAGGLVLLAGIMLQIYQTGNIAFQGFSTINLASSLILIGFLVNAAAIPFSSWLSDAYPESTIMGGVILSAYTSKTAVYTLIRGFAGWDILIFIGCAMAIYGIIYALMENNIRRILAFSIINQIGFMICAIGIGSKLAIAGAVAHAFCHIIYKGLLWMTAGVVIQQTGRYKCTDLGGLYRQMPFTFIFVLIGALTCSALPFTGGFISKAIILFAVEHAHLFWPWLILEVASAGSFLYLGIKYPYFVFFNQKSKSQAKEAPTHMLLAMGFLSFICIYLGLFPNTLYQLLPYSEEVLRYIPAHFSDIYIHHFAHILTKMQLLLFSALVFVFCLPLIRRFKSNSISLDFDWLYRKGAAMLSWAFDKSLNSFNSFCDQLFLKTCIPAICRFAKQGPAYIAWAFLKPLYLSNEQVKPILMRRIEHNKVSVTATSLSFFAVICLLIYQHLF
eukprot:COSAG06_NODE_10665_length_1640_cov_1.289422_1_plen_498_part_00